MINPMKFMQVKSMLATLKQNHPKFPSFLDAVSKRALCKDTIIEIKVTTPDGESLESNLRLKESDLEVLRQMQELRKEGCLLKTRPPLFLYNASKALLWHTPLHTLHCFLSHTLPLL